MLRQTWLSWLEDKYYRLKKIFWEKFRFIQCQFMELSNLVFVAMVATLPRQPNFYKFCFANGIHRPGLSIKSSVILRLFRIILSKFHHYTPESRLQTPNRETWIMAIIRLKKILYFFSMCFYTGTRVLLLSALLSFTWNSWKQCRSSYYCFVFPTKWY